MTEAELAVVGAGAAGLYVALCAAAQGAKVALISATSHASSSVSPTSTWAREMGAQTAPPKGRSGGEHWKDGGR